MELTAWAQQIPVKLDSVDQTFVKDPGLLLSLATVVSAVCLVAQKLHAKPRMSFFNIHTLDMLLKAKVPTQRFRVTTIWVGVLENMTMWWGPLTITGNSDHAASG